MDWLAVPDWLTALFRLFAPLRDSGEVVGLICSVIVSVSLLFQPIKILRTRSARDVSALYLIFFGVAALGWLFYGLTFAAIPIVLANLVAFASMVISLVAKIIYDRRDVTLRAGHAATGSRRW